MCNKDSSIRETKKLNMPEDLTSIKAMEEDLVKTPAEVDVPEVNVAEVSVVATKKRRRRKKKNRKKKKKKGAIENPEGGNICQLQDTPLDAEMALVPLRTNVDSTAMALPIKKDEVANQQLLLAVPFQLLPEKVRNVFPKRKLLILDLNGLLADIIAPPPRDRKSDINISGRGVFKRPFYYDFLKFCFERFDVAVWSSRSKKIVDRVVDYLFGGLKHKLLFCWNMFHCTGTRFKTLENRHKPLVFKELRKIWEKHYDNLPWERGDYNESNTLLLDDSPYKALLNPMNSSIFPFTFTYKDTGDKSLGAGGDLRVYLEELAKAENVQTYIQQHPFGQCAINEKSSLWSFYSTVLSAEPNQG